MVFCLLIPLPLMNWQAQISSPRSNKINLKNDTNFLGVYVDELPTPSLCPIPIQGEKNETLYCIVITVKCIGSDKRRNVQEEKKDWVDQHPLQWASRFNPIRITDSILSYCFEWRTSHGSRN